MKLILDNNILFSIMKPDSVNSYLFSSLRAKFFAPEYLKSEFNAHKSECLSKSNLSEQEFEIRQREVEERIEFFKLSEYKTFLKKSIGVVHDPDDADFLALALSAKSAIWSNDPHLKKQSLVRAYSTKELIDKLLKEEL